MSATYDIASLPPTPSSRPGFRFASGNLFSDETSPYTACSSQAYSIGSPSVGHAGPSYIEVSLSEPSFEPEDQIHLGKVDSRGLIFVKQCGETPSSEMSVGQLLSCTTALRTLPTKCSETVGGRMKAALRLIDAFSLEWNYQVGEGLLTPQRESLEAAYEQARESVGPLS